MDYDNIIRLILLGHIIFCGIEIALIMAFLETSEFWYFGIKACVFVALLISMLFATIVIKDDNPNQMCYNETLSISSYNIQYDYIYLYDTDNNVKIYPIVDGVNITNGECNVSQ